LKRRTRRKRAEMERRGLRMAPEKLRRRELHHLFLVSIIVLLIIFFNFL